MDIKWPPSLKIQEIAVRVQSRPDTRHAGNPPFSFSRLERCRRLIIHSGLAALCRPIEFRNAISDSIDKAIWRGEVAAAGIQAVD